MYISPESPFLIKPRRLVANSWNRSSLRMSMRKWCVQQRQRRARGSEAPRVMAVWSYDLALWLVDGNFGLSDRVSLVAIRGWLSLSTGV